MLSASFFTVDEYRALVLGIAEASEFRDALWGVFVQTDDGETLVNVNGEKAMIPASVLKLYTTATALDILGAERRFTTRLHHTGAFQGETLDGSLYLVGDGDPTLGGRFHDGDMTHTLDRWAETLATKGIREVAGDVVGDDRLFADDPIGDGWEHGDLVDWLAAPVNALCFNDNCIDILQTPASIGETPAFTLEPDTRYMKVASHVVACAPENEDDVYFHREWGSNEVLLTGNLSVTKKRDRDWFSVPDPARFAAFVLKERLERQGIHVQGEAKNARKVADAPTFDAARQLPVVAEEVSPTVREIVRVVNKNSQNLYAEVLLRRCGLERFGDGSGATGAYAVTDFLKTQGLDTQGVVPVDGSGLSRKNTVTAKATTELIQRMRRNSFAEAFFESLPIAGVDGSLAGRKFNGAAAARALRAKTGSMRRVVGLAGSVNVGRAIYDFSFLCNHFTAPRERVTDAVNRLADGLARVKIGA